MDSFKEGVAKHLAATTPLPAPAAALVVEHCGYQLEHRGYLEDFEQALLVRVARFAVGPPVAPARKRREIFKSAFGARKRIFC
jgi:hypothetical protein